MNNVTDSGNMTSRVDTSAGIHVVTYVALTLSAIGLVENGVIVLLLCTRPLLRQRPHVIFTLSLSCSDFLSSFIVILICIALFDPAIYSKTFCLITFIGSMISFGTSLLQALIISLERVLAISTSSVYVQTFKGNRKFVIILIAWLILSLYSISLVIAFPVTGSYIGCSVIIMYDKQSYFGIRIGTQIIFVPLVFATLVLYAVAAVRLHKRMKQVTFSGKKIMSHRPVSIIRVRQEGASATTAEAKIANDMCLNANASAGWNAIDRSNTQQLTPTTPNVATTSRMTTDRTCSSLETKILEKETINIRKLSGALKTVTLVQLFLFVSFVPLSFVRILILFNVKGALAAESLMQIMPLLHPVINPILYVWLIKEFRMVLLCRK